MSVCKPQVKTGNRWAICLTVLALLFTSGRASSQALLTGVIAYNNYDFSSGQPVAHLSVINPDGTGDRRLPVNLPEPGYPVWARNGTLLALTSPDPARPFKISRDVFTYDLLSGQVTKAAGYDDIAGAQDGVFYMPLFKAFSPDSRQLAVSAYRFSYASITITFTNTMFTNGIPGQPTQEQSAVSVSPVLSIYTPGAILPALVMLGDANEGLYHGGDGLDWAWTQNKLVYPVKISVPFPGSALNSYVTALYLLDPVDNAFIAGRAQQLTFPSGRLSTSFFDPIIIEWQEDIQPTVSPEGTRVAYIRLRSALVRPVGQRAFDMPSLRIINLDGSGDREVIAFQQGSYVSHVTWTADGTELVFDGGQQAFTQGGPLPMVAAGTVQLYSVKTDGTGFRELRAAAAVWPACRPASSVVNPPQNQVRLSARPRVIDATKDIILAWPASATNAVLEASDDLGAQANWQPVNVSPVVSDSERTVGFTPGNPTRFYRLRSP